MFSAILAVGCYFLSDYAFTEFSKNGTPWEDNAQLSMCLAISIPIFFVSFFGSIWMFKMDEAIRYEKDAPNKPLKYKYRDGDSFYVMTKDNIECWVSREKWIQLNVPIKDIGKS